MRGRRGQRDSIDDPEQSLAFVRRRWLTAERPVEGVVVQAVPDQLHRTRYVKIPEYVVQYRQPLIRSGLKGRSRPAVAGLSQPRNGDQGAVQGRIRVLRRTDVVARRSLRGGAHRVRVQGG